MSEYTIKQFSSIFRVSTSVIERILKEEKMPYITKYSKERYFDNDALQLLKKKFYKSIEVIEVPKYIPVYFEIIASKINPK